VSVPSSSKLTDLSIFERINSLGLRRKFVHINLGVADDLVDINAVSDMTCLFER
jgi:hypothetical protein